MDSMQKLGWRPRISLQHAIFAVLLALLLTLGVATLILASDVSNAQWQGLITVSNNGTATSVVSVNLSLNSASLIANGYAASNLTDIAVQLNGVDTAFMPAVNATYPWVLFVPNIGAGQNVNYDIYSGGASGGKIRYFPGPDGMTTSDDADLELGDNFTIEQKGWVDTTNVGANLTNKDDAIRIWVSDTGNISAVSYGDVQTFTLLPIGLGDYENIGNEVPGASEHWTCVDDPVGSPDDITSYVSGDSAGFYYDAYLTENQTILDDGCIILGVEVTVRGRSYDDNQSGAGFRGGLRLGTSEVTGTNHWELAWTTHSENLTRPGGGVWGVDDINNLQLRAGVARQGSSNDRGYITQIYLTVYYVDGVTASGISSGEYRVRTWADTADLHISIDGVESDNISLGGFSIPDNSNNWDFMQGIDYMEYSRIWVDGVLQQDISWEYATTFTDQSGNSHHATPTFRTTSSDADVSAALTSFGPAEEAQLSTFTLVSEYEILTGNASLISAGTYTELDVSKIPGGEAANELLTEGGVPQAAWWYPFLFLGICVVGLIVYGATTLNRSGLRGRLVEGQVDGSLLIMFVIMEAALTMLGIMGVIPKWPFMIFPIAGIAIIMSRKHYSWG